MGTIMLSLSGFEVPQKDGKRQVAWFRSSEKLPGSSFRPDFSSHLVFRGLEVFLPDPITQCYMSA